MPDATNDRPHDTPAGTPAEAPATPANQAAPAAPASRNLLGIPPTYLPDDFPDVEVARIIREGGDAMELAAQHPASCLAWAVLGQEALSDGEVVTAYAYARTGYHRGLDALRRAGWRGQGPIPASHAPNRGFLRALAVLGTAARRLGEDDEADRIEAFLREADPSLVD